MKADNAATNRRGTKRKKVAAKEGGVVHVNASPSATKKGKTGGGDKNDKSKKSKDEKGTKSVLLFDEGKRTRTSLLTTMIRLPAERNGERKFLASRGRGVLPKT